MISALFPISKEVATRSRGAHRSIVMTTPDRKSGYHESVLLDETIERLAPAPGKVFVDGTVGGGGHSAALLSAGATVIGLDQDAEALDEATRRLAEFGGRFQPIRSTFAEVGEVLDGMGILRIDGALLDLGVSSHQLETPERGFSFQHEGPLDMRMDQRGLVTAADLVNTMSGEQLERLFRKYGEETAARKIAASISRARMVKPITTTLALAQLIESVLPRRGRAHPATRTFQALRIAVNRELEVLTEGLAEIASRLAPGGRFAVISFHSLEDRIVKDFFKSRSKSEIDRPEWPGPRPNPECVFRLITRKSITASDAEQRANPRARSARLRVVERL
jgi:16S rRNA (cytosine1402-N4)-methyltransferase